MDPEKKYQHFVVEMSEPYTNKVTKQTWNRNLQVDVLTSSGLEAAVKAVRKKHKKAVLHTVRKVGSGAQILVID